MSEHSGITVDSKIQALQAQTRPRLTGRIIGQGSDSVAVQSGASILEIPRRSIVHQEEKDGQAFFTLADDAEIVVSTVVSARHGFIADNVFGALGSFMDASNCNCNCSGGNCNCNCSSGERMVEAAAERLEALAPGARRFRRFLPGGGNE